MMTSRIKGGDRRYPTGDNSANAAAASAAVAAGSGTIHHICGYSTIAQYIQIHDAAALPANGINCLFTLPVLADNWFEKDFGEGGLPFFNGIQLCNSTTAIAKTLGAADCQFVCSYRLKHS